MKNLLEVFVVIVSLGCHIATAQTNLFPLYSSGTYSGGSLGDLTDVTNAQLKLQSTGGSYIRVPHISSHSTVSTVYNFEAGKQVYWGEDNDGGSYIFRGRNFGIGTSAPGGRLDVNAGSQFAIRTATSNRYVIEVRNTSDIDGGWWLVNDPNGSFAIHENSIGDQVTVKPGGSVGIGTSSPTDKLDVRGNLVLDPGDNPRLYTGTSAAEQNRYLFLLNSPALHNASGLKAGGILVADNYDYASPGKNDMVVKGSVGIGTVAPGSFKLAVNGKIWTQEVNVQMTNPGPDYVFEKDYNLLPLSELANYIKQNKHLPEVPSAKEMEKDGLNLKEMNLLLLKKVEELTLHVIELKEENGHQEMIIEQLMQEMKLLKKSEK